MSDWFFRYSKPSALPPPADGIRAKSAGSTWWGQRWLSALEAVGIERKRLGRGRTYARAGRVSQLEVTAGSVSARVTGSRPTPYTVTMKLRVLTDRDWAAAIGVMSEQAAFGARLLAGEMPTDIEQAFGKAHLFPATRADLATACSCPDAANPCKHVAATHYVLGEAFDADPFLIFELRGRTRDQVLDELRRLRGGAAEVAAAEPPAEAAVAVDAAAFEAPRAPLHVPLHPPEAPAGTLLRQLGAPPARDPDALAASLQALVAAAAARARELAVAEPPEAPPPRRRRTDR